MLLSERHPFQCVKQSVVVTYSTLTPVGQSPGIMVKIFIRNRACANTPKVSFEDDRKYQNKLG